MADTTASFEELVNLARRGEPAAVEQLIKVYEPKVRVVARTRLGKALRPYLDSVDLVQSLHRSLMIGLRDDRFDVSSPEKLVALASTIVRRKVASHWRRMRRQQRMEGTLSESQNLPELFLTLNSSESDPATVASLRDATRQLFQALNESDRQLVEMRLEGYSTAEIAQQLSVQPNVLRVRLSRLRRRLNDGGLVSEWI